MSNILGAVKSADMYAKSAGQLEKLKKATDGLEAFMFKSLLSSIKKSEGGLFGKSMAGKQIYQDMFEQTVSDTMAQRGALGIGKSIYDRVAPLAIANEELRLQQQSATISPKTGAKSS